MTCTIPRNGSAIDTCLYLRQDCTAWQDRYLQWYYCTHTDYPVLASWGLAISYLTAIVILFFALGLLASDYLTPNLLYLSKMLRMDEKMAGLTLLALANGAPDISSTYAAMSSNSTSLAIGELLGSTNFELAVVLGAMALVRPFKVSYTSFIRDLSLFAILMVMSFGFLSDGQITVTESILMITLYFFYILVSWFQPEPSIILEEPDLCSVQSVQSSALLSPSLGMAHLAQNVENLESGKSYRLSLFDSVKLAWTTWTSHTHEPLLRRPTTHSSVDDMRQDLADRFDIPAVITPHSEHSDKSSVKQQQESELTPLLPPERSMTPISSADSGHSVILAAVGVPLTSYTTYMPERNLFYRIFPRPETLVQTDRCFSVGSILCAPFSIFFNMCIPVPIPDDISETDRPLEKKINMKLFQLQVLSCPFLITRSFSWISVAISVTLGLVTFILGYVPFYLRIFEPLASITGFANVLCIIAMTASGIVKLLKDAGGVYQISDSLLGIFVLSLGNSIGDLLTNTTLSSLGFALTGLNACFGSSLLYVLLGIGLNSIIVNLTENHGPIKFEVDNNLRITTYSILFTMGFYLITVPCNGGVVSRKIGAVGILIWVVTGAINVYYR